jgi:hypothetical protein
LLPGCSTRAKRYIVGVDFGTSFTGFLCYLSQIGGSRSLLTFGPGWPDAP